MARLRETITDLERQLHAVRSRIEGETELHAAVVRQQRQAEELARVARLVNETLDLATVGERSSRASLGCWACRARPSGCPAGWLAGGLAAGGGPRSTREPQDLVPAGVGLGRAGGPRGAADVDAGLPRRRALRDQPGDPRAERRPRNRRRARGAAAGDGRVTACCRWAHPTAAPSPRPRSPAADLRRSGRHRHRKRRRRQEALAASRPSGLRILHEIDRALIAEQAPDAIAEAALRPLRELLEVPRVIVNIFDLEAGEVDWLAAVGPPAPAVGPGRALSAGAGRRPRGPAARRAAARRRRRRCRRAPRRTPCSHRRPGYMVVPMIAGGELIGSLSFGGGPRSRFRPSR